MKLVPSLFTFAMSAAVLHSAAASGPIPPLAPPQVEGYKALPMKKMGSGVVISYRIEGTPTPGIPVIIHLTTESRTDAQIKLRGGEGLVLSGGDTPLTTLISPAGQITQHRVEVIPQTNGRLYLYLESSANGRGNASAIAVQVGKAQAISKPSGNLQSMPDGERLISVPAKQ